MWHGFKQECIIIIIIIIVVIILGGRSGDGGCGSDRDYFCALHNCELRKIEHVEAWKQFHDE